VRRPAGALVLLQPDLARLVVDRTFPGGRRFGRAGTVAHDEEDEGNGSKRDEEEDWRAETAGCQLERSEKKI